VAGHAQGSGRAPGGKGARYSALRMLCCSAELPALERRGLHLGCGCGLSAGNEKRPGQKLRPMCSTVIRLSLPRLTPHAAGRWKPGLQRVLLRSGGCEGCCCNCCALMKLPLLLVLHAAEAAATAVAASAVEARRLHATSYRCLLGWRDVTELKNGWLLTAAGLLMLLLPTAAA